MRRKILRIGRIPYANLFPFFYYLESECDNSIYRFINGHPSRLNKLLREGLLDISPSSSIEYIRNKDEYSLLPFLSVSSIERIESIMLFSNMPINELHGKTVNLSSDSDTSVVLLKIILREFEGVMCRFRTATSHDIKRLLSTSSAVLFIGDIAMKEAKRLSLQNIKTDSRGPTHDGLYLYDLGSLWYKHTGLPFVFALWIVRNDVVEKNGALIKRLSLDLYNAKQYIYKNLSSIAEKAPQRSFLSKDELIDYWRTISFDLTEKHLEGLNLFERYSLKNHLL